MERQFYEQPGEIYSTVLALAADIPISAEPVDGFGEGVAGGGLGEAELLDGF